MTVPARPCTARDIEGVHVALFTPLLRDDPRRLRNGIDLEKARTMIEDLLEVGVDGIVPVGTTGQSSTLSTEQHVMFVKFVLECVGDRALVIAGAGSNCTRESVDMIREIQAIRPGLPCLCVTGYYNNPPAEGLAEHYLTVVEETDAPIVLYNVPGRTGSYLDPDTVVRLARHPRILGLKQAVDFVTEAPLRDDTIHILEETAGLEFSVLSGEDQGFDELWRMGGRGIISATANIPEAALAMRRAWVAHLEGDAPKVGQESNIAEEFASWMFRRRSPIPLATVFDSPVLQPLCPLEATRGGEELARQMKAFLREHAPSVRRWIGDSG